MSLQGFGGPQVLQVKAATLRGDAQHFGVVARLLHGITPVLLIGSFGLVWGLSWLPVGADRVQAVSLHRTIGIVVLGLSLIRLVWRLFDRRPTRTGSPALRRGAAVVHACLYAILIAIPLLGWIYTNTRGHKLTILGASLPSLTVKDEYFSRVSITVHEWLAYTLLALVAAHVAAALWHHFVLRDGMLKRMWRF
ncbi:cytochrome b [Lichenifustis flavocetrariae]|uniref:Cytochrome b/b6 domain-containing protein n=1 Tax=Lichenifustis flavocetrariae TaxID=2949735 RepID=A0AA41Z250_9HYPH|nr:cytochrome b/b6 domain-containing protein [Lichenifustis flavocetrariae]MCW6512824.1 cytochrome b/b6 domain-containing protein [Lichenifustis flavocetrariae]